MSLKRALIALGLILWSGERGAGDCGLEQNRDYTHITFFNSTKVQILTQASEEQEIVAPSKIVITPILLASVDDESREDKTDAPATGK